MVRMPQGSHDDCCSVDCHGNREIRQNRGKQWSLPGASFWIERPWSETLKDRVPSASLHRIWVRWTGTLKTTKNCSLAQRHALDQSDDENDDDTVGPLSLAAKRRANMTPRPATKGAPAQVADADIHGDLDLPSERDVVAPLVARQP